MKRVSVLFLLCFLYMSKGEGQAFDKNTRLITFDVGVSDMYHQTIGYHSYHGTTFLLLTGYAGIQPEYAIHRYWSMGFATGIGWRAQTLRYRDLEYSGQLGEISLQLGLVAKFHFYQMLADRARDKSKFHADKLDIYVGAEVGGGLALHDCRCPGSPVTTLYSDVLAYGGFQVGVRYSLTKTVSIFAEAGYGKTIFNLGVAVNFGRKKEQKIPNEDGFIPKELMKKRKK